MLDFAMRFRETTGSRRLVVISTSISKREYFNTECQYTIQTTLLQAVSLARTTSHDFRRHMSDIDTIMGRLLQTTYRSNLLELMMNVNTWT